MRPLIDLDLNLLVVFRLLLQERSVTKAAKKLNVTAPTVSKALARLRDWFDDPLFLRTQRGLEPTNLSLTLEEELKEWFQLSGNIASLCGNAIPAGAAFRLVLESPFYISFLNDLPMVIYETYRKSTIRIMNWDHHSLNDIINGDADLGFCARETHPSSLARVNRLPYYIDHEVLFEDRPMVFLRKDHPLLARTWNLDNFLAYPHVSVVWEASDAWALDSLLDDEGLSRQVPIRVSSFEQALHIAAQSDHELIAVVPSYCASYARQHHDNLISLPLPLDEDLYRQLDIAFILLWHKAQQPQHQGAVAARRDQTALPPAYRDHWRGLTLASTSQGQKNGYKHRNGQGGVMDDESRDMAVMVALYAGLGTGLAAAGGGGGHTAVEPGSSSRRFSGFALGDERGRSALGAAGRAA